MYAALCYMEVTKTRLKMNGVRECLLDKRLQLFGHPKRMEENGLSSTCRTLKICSSFLRE